MSTENSSSPKRFESEEIPACDSQKRHKSPCHWTELGIQPGRIGENWARWELGGVGVRLECWKLEVGDKGCECVHIASVPG